MRTASITLTALGILAMTAVASPASADRDGWGHKRGHGRHHYHDHHYRPHYYRPPVYYAPPRVYRPYVPPPVYYAPPPVYYGPPVIGFGFTIR